MRIFSRRLLEYSLTTVFVLSCSSSFSSKHQSHGVSASLLRNKDDMIGIDNSNVKRGVEEIISCDDTDYPAIYTIDIPFENARDKSIIEFVATLDLLSSNLVEDGTIVKLTFVLSNEDEYDNISSSLLDINPPSLDMVQDCDETSSLRQFITMPRVAGQSEDTISGYPCYRNLNGMFDLMAELEGKALNIDLLEVENIDIGDSWEKTDNPNNGNDIRALKITGGGVAAKGWSTDKGIVFVTCGVHAREYAPPELCARWAEILVDGYGIDTEITSILDHTEVHMIIESNPDGRTIAEDNRSLMWRKNTRPGCRFNNSFLNKGVDLNRNFPFKWGLNSGSSNNNCDATYRGKTPASEPEVQAILAYAESVFPESQRKNDPIGQIDVPFPEDSTVGVFYDIHAYSDLIIWPWSFENKYTANEESLQAFSRKLKSFNNYALAGPKQPDFLYEASGVTADYFYGELGAASFVYELGTEFYQDCESFENTINPDNQPGFMYTAKVSTKPYLLVKGPDITDLSVPNTINYHPTTKLVISITASDSELSSGPGNHLPSTQDIASINIYADMHPYDIDSNGDGPQKATLPATNNSGTTTKQVAVPLSIITPYLQAPLIGDHLLYAEGTDDDGFTGPVETVSFTITCNDVPSFPVDGIDRNCDWVVSNGYCSNVEAQVVCPSACNIC